MNKVSAEKIRSLEMRIARLEKEAGFIDDMVGVFKSTLNSLINIPKNMLLKIMYAFKEVWKSFELSLEDEDKKIDDALGALLGARVFRAMAGVTTSTADLPRIVTFKRKDPLKSFFTGGLAGSKKLHFKNLVKLYENEKGNQKRMKAAYLSWYSDYKNILNPKLSEEEGVNLALVYIKRISKLAYRLLTSVIAVLGGIAVIKGTVISNLLFMLGKIFLRKQGFPVGKPIGIDKLDVNITFRQKAIDTGRNFDLLDPFEESFTIPNQTKDLYLQEAKAVVVRNPHMKYKMEHAQSMKDVKEFLSLNSLKYAATIATPILALLEAAMYRWVIKTDEYDDMVKEVESRGKKRASQYPTLSYITYRLENAIAAR